jgi:hypothetical protein
MLTIEILHWNLYLGSHRMNLYAEIRNPIRLWNFQLGLEDTRGRVPKARTTKQGHKPLLCHSKEVVSRPIQYVETELSPPPWPQLAALVPTELESTQHFNIQLKLDVPSNTFLLKTSRPLDASARHSFLFRAAAVAMEEEDDDFYGGNANASGATKTEGIHDGADNGSDKMEEGPDQNDEGSDEDDDSVSGALVAYSGRLTQRKGRHNTRREDHRRASRAGSCATTSRETSTRQ